MSESQVKVTPLYGHTSEETAYVVDDYPYGFRLRTQIRYWLEESPKAGFRFVSQTKNPKNGTWNAPKRSTYQEFAGAMYLDENGHVKWTGLGVYSGAKGVLEFVQQFPDAPLTTRLRAFIVGSIAVYRKFADGTAHMTINGVPQVRSDADRARDAETVEAWREVLAVLRRRGEHMEGDL